MGREEPKASPRNTPTAGLGSTPISRYSSERTAAGTPITITIGMKSVLAARTGVISRTIWRRERMVQSSRSVCASG